MFAGPNGSGKSTLKSVLPAELLGCYLNPDEIEALIRVRGLLDFGEFGLAGVAGPALAFLRDSAFLQTAGLGFATQNLSADGNRLQFNGVEVNAYFASVIADFLRRQLLERRVSFTLETVMSSPDKVALLEQAQRLGYRTYLYFVATDDPAINISRVRNRVKLGGHAVPEEKIVSRYHRSLGLLREAIRHTNRTYVFDNSSDGQSRTWVAEVTDGREFETKTDHLPAWLRRAVLDAEA
jgi:predicted ABC-type ATPase